MTVGYGGCCSRTVGHGWGCCNRTVRHGDFVVEHWTYVQSNIKAIQYIDNIHIHIQYIFIYNCTKL